MTRVSARDPQRRERRVAARAERERQRRRAELRRRTRVAAAVVGAIAVVAALGAFLVRDASSGVAFAGDLRTGGSLESLSLPALDGGGTVDYAAYADGPLVINFFASWCPNCIAEMPDFESVHQRLGDQVTFLGVSQSDAADASIELAHQTGITYPTARDPNGSLFNAFGATGMPTTVFIAPGGQIVDVWTGALDDASLSELISQNLGVPG